MPGVLSFQTRALLALSCGAVLVVTGLQPAAAAPQATRQPTSQATPAAGPPQLALHYDFGMDEGERTSDASGNGHDGQLVGATLTEGRLKNAVQLAGAGSVRMATVPASMDPRMRALTVGAFCRPSALDGVLLAMGDSTNGYCLYLEAGVPHFAVRAAGDLTVAVGRDPVVVDQWVHLAGAIDPRGTVYLLVNGWTMAAVTGSLVTGTPTEPFAVGMDVGSPVGRYGQNTGWAGLVQDVRLYWGYLDRQGSLSAWQTWADLPGCLCKQGSRY